jgi:hydrogenase/urease accessory protein HupE
MTVLCAAPARTHEVIPAISDLTVAEGKLTWSVEMPVEGLLAGIDLAAIADTNEAPEAADYDSLRALPAQDLQARLASDWPELAGKITILADGVALTPDLGPVEVPAVGDVALPRLTRFEIVADIPPDAETVEVGWDRSFGGLVIRQMGVDSPYDGFLTDGATSGPIPVAGGRQAGQVETFFDYIPVGFDHIVPKGLDHILFVLGLFFLAAQLGPLLWQVTAFTAAHTITLALGALGIVNLPGNIVEPIIAASIVFVAVENIISPRLHWWRPIVVFGFGLLHGLGFASVLGDFGLPENAFIPALVGFNIGVELGQLTVIVAAFALVGYWFRNRPWYRARIAVPASVFIALVGAWWVIERTVLA